MVTFNNLIIKIFKSHGFEINSSSSYSKYILASKDNINLSIGYFEPDEEAEVSKMRNFFRNAKKDNADRLIYIIPTRTYPNAVEKFADDRKIQLWNRERFERELGRAVIVNLKAGGNAEDFSSELSEYSDSNSPGQTDEMLSPDLAFSQSEPEPTPTSTTEDIPIMVPFLQLTEDTMPVPSSSLSSPAAHESPGSIYSSEINPETILPDTMPQQSKDIRIIKPTVSKDKASSMASKIVKGFRFNLELIPYYIFTYTCKFDSDLPGEDSISGLIGINGLTSNVESWSGEINTIEYLDEAHTKLEVKFPYEKAISLANSAIVELNTKSIETREESESTIIFERKKLKPKSDAIEVNSKGIYYLPVWCIEGSNGLMIIDASSGKIIKEDMF